MGDNRGFIKASTKPPFAQLWLRKYYPDSHFLDEITDLLTTTLAKYHLHVFEPENAIQSWQKKSLLVMSKENTQVNANLTLTRVYMPHKKEYANPIHNPYMEYEEHVGHCTLTPFGFWNELFPLKNPESINSVDSLEALLQHLPHQLHKVQQTQHEAKKRSHHHTEQQTTQHPDPFNPRVKRVHRVKPQLFDLAQTPKPKSEQKKETDVIAHPGIQHMKFERNYVIFSVDSQHKSAYEKLIQFTKEYIESMSMKADSQYKTDKSGRRYSFYIPNALHEIFSFNTKPTHPYHERMRKALVNGAQIGYIKTAKQTQPTTVHNSQHLLDKVAIGFFVNTPHLITVAEKIEHPHHSPHTPKGKRPYYPHRRVNEKLKEHVQQQLAQNYYQHILQTPFDVRTIKPEPSADDYKLPF
jgi:hypothetical protein